MSSFLQPWLELVIVSCGIVSLKRIENSEQKLNFWLAKLLKVKGEYRSEQIGAETRDRETRWLNSRN